MPNVDNWNRLDRTQGHDLPWCVEQMPSWFTEVVDSGWMNPCKALDVGCEVGNYACHLAERGRDILCLDHSETAVALAKEENSHPSIRFYGRARKTWTPLVKRLISSMTSRHSIV